MRPQTLPFPPFVLPEENSSSPRPPFTSFLMPSPLAALYPSSSAPLPHASPARGILFRRYCSYPRLPRNFPMRPQAHSFPLASFSKKTSVLPTPSPLSSSPLSLGIPQRNTLFSRCPLPPFLYPFSTQPPRGDPLSPLLLIPPPPSQLPDATANPPFSPCVLLDGNNCHPPSCPHSPSSSPLFLGFFPKESPLPAPLLHASPAGGSSFVATAQASASLAASRCDRKPTLFPFHPSRRGKLPSSQPLSSASLPHASPARGILFHRYCSILRLLYNFPMRPQTHPFPLASFSKRKIAILPGPLSLLVPSFPWLFPKEYPLSRCPLPPFPHPSPTHPPQGGSSFSSSTHRSSSSATSQFARIPLPFPHHLHYLRQPSLRFSYLPKLFPSSS